MRDSYSRHQRVRLSTIGAAFRDNSDRALEADSIAAKSFVSVITKLCKPRAIKSRISTSDGSWETALISEISLSSSPQDAAPAETFRVIAAHQPSSPLLLIPVSLPVTMASRNIDPVKDFLDSLPDLSHLILPSSPF